jgi:HK97 family phage prohead protease
MEERRSYSSVLVGPVRSANAITGKGTPEIAGYAAVFNEEFVLYEDDVYRVVEQIRPGAFSDVLGNDVRCLFNHDSDHVLGRTENSTLRLTEDSRGLRFRNSLDTKTSMGQNVYRFVSRGDVTGCSFAFIVAADEWAQATQADGRTVVTRTITKIAKLLDVGPVTYPAYPQTSVGT